MFLANLSSDSSCDRKDAILASKKRIFINVTWERGGNRELLLSEEWGEVGGVSQMLASGRDVFPPLCKDHELEAKSALTWLNVALNSSALSLAGETGLPCIKSGAFSEEKLFFGIEGVLQGWPLSMSISSLGAIGKYGQDWWPFADFCMSCK